MKCKKIVIAFLTCIMLACIGLQVGHMVQADELTDAEQERQKLEERKKETEKELENLQLEKEDLLESIEKLDKKTAEVNAQLEEINANVESTEEELSILKEELAIAEENEQKQYDTMKKRIQYMYENGSGGYLEVVLHANSISDCLNRLEYVNKIVDYDANMWNTYKTIKEEVTEKKAATEAKKEQLDILQEEVSLEQDNLNKIVEKKAMKLEKYEKDIEGKSQEAKDYQKKLEKKEKEIEKLLLEQAMEADGGMEITVVEGGLRWPLGVSGTITSNFGPRKAPTAGASTYHKGIDIAAPVGTTIYAAADGVVTTATYSSSAGNYVMINHGNGLYTAYMHASRLDVKVGDQVSQGDAIAAVGSTGVSTGAHLHFSVITGGKYVNPLNYVKQP
ncbi:MAG: peptidoglycan DD-metalloendopeptidase family protein [Lachnospiraceae bacterium]|nr:peptidoglycan DD-metalloendopeptidase family protein [Lachnospiraceae bacterium]